MLLDILRALRGSVRFTVSGKYPERFLNITSRNRIRLWDVQRTDTGFTACMYRSDYRNIRSPARGAGVKLRVLQKYGMPEWIFRFRDRTGVVIGACAFVLTVFILSQFIWSVDIAGLDTLSLSQMKDVLREHGLYVGAFKPSLDYQQIARDILLERHEIGWMAVNVTGSYASVEVKEEAPAPAVEDVDTPCNIKAKSDGQILRIEASEGDTVIMEGSGVIEGQIVVSGVRTDEQGASRLVHADARVIARTTRQASFSVSETTSCLRPVGDVVRRKSLEWFGLRLPYRFGAVDTPYQTVSTLSESPCALDITLPVGVTTETVSGLAYEEITFDENSAKELLLREARLYEAFTLKDCTVESREERLSRRGGAYTLNVTYTCVEDIAYKDPIGTDENTDLTRYAVPTEKP